MQRPSQILSGRLETEHEPLKRILGVTSRVLKITAGKGGVRDRKQLHGRSTAD
jgi:hypothetical protein